MVGTICFSLLCPDVYEPRFDVGLFLFFTCLNRPWPRFPDSIVLKKGSAKKER